VLFYLILSNYPNTKKIVQKVISHGEMGQRLYFVLLGTKIIFASITSWDMETFWKMVPPIGTTMPCVHCITNYGCAQYMFLRLYKVNIREFRCHFLTFSRAATIIVKGGEGAKARHRVIVIL
jgi:hypothetical protein